MKGMLIIGHGSRSAQAVAEFETIVALVSKQRADVSVYGAHMELAEPDIPTTLDAMMAAGIDEITCVPCFLFTGNHLKHDIPEILELEKQKRPNVRFCFARPIGADAVLADILIKRAHEVEAACK